MSNTPVTQCSYSAKAGYVWRKKYLKEALSIALQTQNTEDATKRSAAMSIRFMEIEKLSLPFAAVREALKNYRNELVKESKLNMLLQMASPKAPESMIAPVAMQTPSMVEQVAQAVIQNELAKEEGHTLEALKKAYFEAK